MDAHLAVLRARPDAGGGSRRIDLVAIIDAPAILPRPHYHVAEREHAVDGSQIDAFLIPAVSEDPRPLPGSPWRDSCHARSSRRVLCLVFRCIRAEPAGHAAPGRQATEQRCHVATRRRAGQGIRKSREIITMRLLVTGGSGFIGANLVRLIRTERPAWRVVNLDLLTYAANPANLAGIAEGDHYRFVHGDVADRELVARLFSQERFDAVIHCAAETHVDRSIHDGAVFLRTNVEGTLVLLEAVRATRRCRHVQMGTDEVYGTLGPTDPPFTEQTPLAPRSPYSASKAAADHLVLAFHHTHGVDAVVTRCSNNYGPYQHPEKLIPFMITAAVRGLPLPVYGDGRQRRDWIHVDDHCRGVLATLEHGRAGQVYNFGGDAERQNIDVVRQVMEFTGADPALITHVADRPGHDWRYAMSFRKAEHELGWCPRRSFEAGLADTVDWYSANRTWWSRAADIAYKDGFRRITAWATSDTAGTGAMKPRSVTPPSA
jgi:dTDP-glucose 4,6-dehydratase